MSEQNADTNKSFRVEEASIDDLHNAIREGRTTCVDVVKQYISLACLQRPLESARYSRWCAGCASQRCCARTSTTLLPN